MAWLVCPTAANRRAIGEVEGSIRWTICQVIGAAGPKSRFFSNRSTGFLTVLTDPHNAPVAVLAEENGTILTSENHKLKPSAKMEILVWRALVWAHRELRGSRDDSPSIRSAPGLDTAFL